jgi:hypothetical protein
METAFFSQLYTFLLNELNMSASDQTNVTLPEQKVEGTSEEHHASELTDPRTGRAMKN